MQSYDVDAAIAAGYKFTIVIASGTRDANPDDHQLPVAEGLLRARRAAVLSPPYPILLVEGGAAGVDTLARVAAKMWGWHYKTVPARWAECGADCPGDGGKHRRFWKSGGSYCPYAGPRRNQEMLDRYPPAILAAFPAIKQPPKTFQDLRNMSRGTWDMIERCAMQGVPYLSTPLSIRLGQTPLFDYREQQMA